MSYEREMRRKMERHRKTKIYYIERELKKPVEPIRFKGSILHAVYELKNPSNPKFTPLSDSQIYQDLEDLGLKYPY